MSLQDHSSRASRERSMSRRSFLVGRPFPAVFGAGGRFSSTGVRSSYSVCASGAGPRRVPTARTRTTRIFEACGKVSVSPAPMAWAGLEILFEFTRTCPPETSLLANPRVLRNRAYHSHLSTRMVSRGDCKSGLVLQSHQSGGKGIVRINLLFGLCRPR